MTLSITHDFVSMKSDGTDATQVKPSDWNHIHDIKTDVTTGIVLGRSPGGSGDIQELPMSITPSGRVAVLGTDGFAVPSGTTLQRPTSPKNGEFRYNSTLGQVECYQGGRWASVPLGYSITQALGSVPFDFTNIPTWVNAIQVEFNVYCAATDVLVLQLYNSSGVIDTGPNYYMTNIVAASNNSGGNPITTSAGAQTFWPLGAFYPAPVAGSFSIAGIQSAWRQTVSGQCLGTSSDAAAFVLVPFAGQHLPAGPITGFRLVCEAGTNSIAGTVSMIMVP